MTQRNFAVDQGLQINSTVGNTTIDNNGITQMPDQDFTILVQDADDDDYALNLDVDDGAGNILARAQLTRGDFAITTDFAGAGHNWTFDNTGRLNLPGNIAFSPTGGNVSFYAVDDGNTGSVELKTISYAGDLLGSNIRVTQSNATISTGNAAHTWTFDNTGNLNLPRGGVVYETNIPFGGLTGNTIALAPSGGTNADQQLLIYPTAGNVDANHLHLTSGNLYNTELYLGNDDLYVKLANTGNIVINSNDNTGNTAQWTFDTTGTLTFPGGDAAIVPDLGGTTSFQGAANTGVVVTSSGNVGSVVMSWVDQTTDLANSRTASMTLNSVGTANAQIQVADLGANSINNWTFDNTGNLTLPGNTFAVNYANGTAVSLGGGGGGSYGDSNVVSLLAAYGSNTISTTGTITSGNILSNGYARLSGSFDESQASTAGLYLGYAGGTPRMMFGTGNTSQTFEIDNDAGTLRFYQPGSTKASLTSDGVFSAAGNITGANISTTGNVSAGNVITIANIRTGGQIQSTAFTGGNISWTANNQTDFQGSIRLGGLGRILSPGGAASIETNNNGANINQLRVTSTIAAANTTSGSLIVSGGAGIAGNVYIGGLANVAGNVTVSGALGVSQPNLPAFRVYGNTSTVYTANTTITNQAVDYNQGNNYNNTTGIFTAPVAGIYQAQATLRVADNNGLNQASIQKNSSSTGSNVVAFWETDTNVGTATHFPLTGAVKLAVGDTLRLQVISGNVQFDINDSWSVTFLG